MGNLQGWDWFQDWDWRTAQTSPWGHSFFLVLFQCKLSIHRLTIQVYFSLRSVTVGSQVKTCSKEFPWALRKNKLTSQQVICCSGHWQIQTRRVATCWLVNSLTDSMSKTCEPTVTVRREKEFPWALRKNLSNIINLEKTWRKLTGKRLSTKF